jgi:hypothetical protein
MIVQRGQQLYQRVVPVPAWRYNPMVERKPRAKLRHPRPQCPPLLSRRLRGQRVPTSPARRPDPQRIQPILNQPSRIRTRRTRHHHIGSSYRHPGDAIVPTQSAVLRRS